MYYCAVDDVFCEAVSWEGALGFVSAVASLGFVAIGSWEHDTVVVGFYDLVYIRHARVAHFYIASCKYLTQFVIVVASKMFVN